MTGQPGQRTPSAGFDRDWTPIPYQRLHPADVYKMVDWVRDGWADDEVMVTPRLQRLKWHLEELPDPYRMEALQQYETVTRARTANGTPWLAALDSMSRIVTAWGDSRSRLPLRT